ncbi:hypothetical protein SAMN06297387_108214 [Streptomyces zhaozhouensis]|uniref:Multiple sugar transport system permease protein n=1 Tax=Streptomyces zhaozhouensis TaxID=1300267 RepID=A0A286DWK9_9ACTN|nr:hypothetical protein [Streptomyces zhaozhouensis]SOD63051.1 hypothetical protein SAMN06297387_108214 [Streptomyces zhaozhouensis]
MSTARRAAVNLLLPVVYVLLFIPAGLLTRLFRDPLHRKPDRSATSYWTDTGPTT